MTTEKNTPASEKPVAAASESPATEPAPAAGAEVAPGGGRSPTVEDVQALLNIEREKRREAERALEARPVPPAGPPAADTRTAARDYQRRIAEAYQDFVTTGNPQSGAVLFEAQQQLLASQASELEATRRLMKVPEKYRDKVIEQVDSAPGSDPLTVYQRLRAAEDAERAKANEAEMETLRRENEELKRAREEPRRGVVGVGRPLAVTAAPGAKIQPRSIAEGNKELDRLAAEGREQERRDLSVRLRRGDLKDLPAQ